jgi:hypothetical protein
VVREEAIRHGEGGSYLAWWGRKPLGVVRKAVLRKEAKKTDWSLCEFAIRPSDLVTALTARCIRHASGADPFCQPGPSSAIKT